MAGPTAAVAEAWDTVTGFLRSQVNDQKNWDRQLHYSKGCWSVRRIHPVHAQLW
ncbi:hypothetical protein BS78_08G114700 [Paspalum vaginatum]|nr:hypothetical protein BS78_08G114700 [Paspalum vaginatum]